MFARNHYCNECWETQAFSAAIFWIKVWLLLWEKSTEIEKYTQLSMLFWHSGQKLKTVSIKLEKRLLDTEEPKRTWEKTSCMRSWSTKNHQFSVTSTSFVSHFQQFGVAIKQYWQCPPRTLMFARLDRGDYSSEGSRGLQKMFATFNSWAAMMPIFTLFRHLHNFGFPGTGAVMSEHLPKCPRGLTSTVLSTGPCSKMATSQPRHLHDSLFVRKRW